jgi:hypothetical protein
LIKTQYLPEQFHEKYYGDFGLKVNFIADIITFSSKIIIFIDTFSCKWYNLCNNYGGAFMKIICNEEKGRIMFDTNSKVVSERKNNISGVPELTIDGGSWAYRGTQSQVQKMFEAIVAAEKRGDKFFEING